jgi:hypothetical protein
MGFAKSRTHPAGYRTGLNVGRSGFACSGLTSVSTRAGVSQSTHAMAIKAAAAIVASALLVNSGYSMLALVAEDHPVLAPCRIIGADQRIRVSCDHGFGQRHRLQTGKAAIQRAHDRAVGDRDNHQG